MVLGLPGIPLIAIGNSKKINLKRKMSIFTYHLVKLSFFSALKMLLFPMKAKRIKGLVYAETMFGMTLGAPVFSLSRILMRQVVVFAQWETEKDLNQFLENSKRGLKLAEGWHIRLRFLRQWGTISGFEIPNEIESESENSDNESTVSITIARLKIFQIPRFIRWGRPVEQLVRDHHAITLALASIRFPKTVSTFSIWKTQKEMTDMVRGHSNVAKPKRISMR